MSAPVPAPRRDPPAELPRTEEALLPTRHGNFRVVAFTDPATGTDHLALIAGNVQGEHGVLVRVHSECLTGDVLGSLRCDCGGQLELAMKRIAEESGILLYLRQEGRGIGLANKVRAYRLQDEGLDTVEANETLGFPSDARGYEVAAAMLATLGVSCVRLMTNNPVKVAALEAAGMKVVAREPHEIPPNHVNRAYLETKRDRMRHALHLGESGA
jgi:3,4-dihydroxy 2-butanone 4-phosphate synthase / GTP cyclohydrolase II